MENWRDIIGWSGFYEVSDLGRVRAGKDRLNRGHVLKASASKKGGYPMVSLTRPGAVRYYAYVHDLVASAFIGPKPVGEEVRHRDGVRYNCAAGNLHYGTRSSNALDRHEHGTMNQAHGEAHYFHKLTADDVRWIRANKGRMTLREMGQKFGVAHKTVQLAQCGQSWTRVA